MVDPDVERWLETTNPRLAEGMRRVADIILGADPRLTAYLKYGIVTFGFDGDLCAFVQATGRRISLMFHRGARIEGDFPHLEGDGPSARFMRFADLAEVDAQADELAGVARAWCELKASERA